LFVSAAICAFVATVLKLVSVFSAVGIPVSPVVKLAVHFCILPRFKVL